MTYYKFNISNDGEFTAEPTNEQIPSNATELVKRYKAVLNKVRLYGAFDETRSHYAHDLLDELESALAKMNSAEPQTPKLNEAEKYINLRYGLVTVKDRQVQFFKAPWAGASIPDEAMAFLSRVDKMWAKVKSLFKEGNQRPEGDISLTQRSDGVAQQTSQPKSLSALDTYLLQLISHAKMGLEIGDIKSATIALDLFAEQFVNDEGPAIRQKHVGATLRWALGISGSALALFVIFHLASLSTYLTKLFPVATIDWTQASITILCLTLGVSLGVTFFAFVRNLNLTFDSLGRFDPAALSSPLRFTLVGIVTAITCLLMGSGLLKIEIGNVALHEFYKNQTTAVLLGLICGYADVAITGMLTSVLDTVNRR